jgi:hypothetical protein
LHGSQIAFARIARVELIYGLCPVRMTMGLLRKRVRFSQSGKTCSRLSFPALPQRMQLPVVTSTPMVLESTPYIERARRARVGRCNHAVGGLNHRRTAINLDPPHHRRRIADGAICQFKPCFAITALAFSRRPSRPRVLTKRSTGTFVKSTST